MKNGNGNITDIEIDLLAQSSVSFKGAVNEMTVEQKRAAIRTFVKKIVWDGSDAHVILFGAEFQYEFPKEATGIGSRSAESKINKMIGGG